MAGGSLDREAVTCDAPLTITGSDASSTQVDASGAQTATTTVMLCGVGGQGTILAADVLCKVAAASGMMVKLSEVHGMAQRGGSVSTVVRFGAQVHAPIADVGSVDALVAFEAIEAVRYLHFLKPAGALFVNDYQMDPLAVRTGAMASPNDVVEKLAARGARFVAASALAQDAGSPKSANIVLMGALSSALPFSVELWERVIADRVPPATREANLAAFHAGRTRCMG